MKKIDLTGKRFGRLLVIGESSEKKHNRPAWICECICGNQVTLSGNDLRSGESKSCGCLRRDRVTQDLKGNIFFKLKVIDKAQKRGKSTSQFWKCLCECGKTHIASAQHLKLGFVRSCGCWFDKKITKEAKEEFFSHVEKTHTCWNWKGRISRTYGMFFYNKFITSHRFSYILHFGDIEKNLIICHKCDNRICVNPEHLYAGTHKDNMRDLIQRNRFRKRVSERNNAKMIDNSSDMSSSMDRNLAC